VKRAPVLQRNRKKENSTLSAYIEIRKLRTSGQSLKAIYVFLKANGICDEKGVPFTYKKVKEAALPLEARIHFLRSSGLRLREIVERVQNEGYVTKRGSSPKRGCVWYVLNRESVLKKKEKARRRAT